MSGREIKFKGKRVDNGEWVYGYYVIEYDTCINHEGKEVHYIYCNNPLGVYRTEVISKSICQFTGLKDKNKNEIYEKDIIHIVKNRFGKNRDEVWSVEYGYFGDPHVLYVHNHLNSGRVVVSDIDELNYVDDTGLWTPIPHFTKSGEDKTELNVIGNRNDKEFLEV